MLGSFCSVHDLSLNIKKYRTMSRNIAQYRAISRTFQPMLGAQGPQPPCDAITIRLLTPLVISCEILHFRQKNCPQSPVALNQAVKWPRLTRRGRAADASTHARSTACSPAHAAAREYRRISENIGEYRERSRKIAKQRSRKIAATILRKIPATLGIT